MEESQHLVQKVALELLSVKRRAQLASVLDILLKAEVRYNQAALFILDNETNQVTDWLQSDGLPTQGSRFSANLHLKDLAIEEIVLDDTDDLQGKCEICQPERWPHSPLRNYFRTAPPPGFRILAFSLRESNDYIGNLLLLFDDATECPLDKLDLLKLLVVTINMAVIRIQVEERRVKPETNDQLLDQLTLSSSLMDLRNYDDLKRIVQQRLLSVFNAVSCVVILSGPDQTCRCLLIVNAPALLVDPLTEDLYSGPFSLYDHCYGKTINGQEINLYDLTALTAMASHAAHVQAELTYGILDKGVYPLRSDGRTIGFIFLHYDRANAIAALSKPANKVLLSQFSKALLHLLAHEQARSRMAQQDMVIELGALIASVRTNEDLLDVINRNLKRILGFTHTNITVINQDKATASAYLPDYHAVSQHHVDYSRVVSGTYALNDGILDKVLSSDEPLVFDLEQLIHRRPLPSYLKINYESGIRQIVMTKFLKGTEAFGIWSLAFNHDHEISTSAVRLIRDVTSQLAVSVQNVLLNLQSERREKEKNRLMQFSHAIASTEDRTRLAKTIKEHLMEFFGIDNFILWSVSKDLQYRSPLLYDKAPRLANHPCFRVTDGKRLSNADGIYDFIMEGPGIRYIDAGELQGTYADHPYFSAELETDQFMAMGGTLLRAGDEVIGLLTFLAPHSQLVQEKEELFLNICSQLAVMASNILTADKIAEQLSEIKGHNERLEDEKIYLLRELELPVTHSDMIGTSTGIQAVLKLIQQVAYTDSTVLISGETGTGKELVARSIHNDSPRKSKLMVKVNCAALPASLIESELFGHEKGSFTGALERRIGKFELANQGTLFLDEIGEMPLDLQSKLLRALQEKEIERVGGKGAIKVDVRVIVATNRNLEMEVASGKFRSDLYYRINIFPIRLPPLRDRLSDLPLLASHFIAKYAAKVGKDIKSLSSQVLQELQRYDWPGNIRELEHAIERSVLLTTGDTLKQVDIPKLNSGLPGRSMYLDKKILTLDENERDHILRILKMCRGRINGHQGAAKLLGVPPSTLNSKMKRLSISKHEVRP